MSNDSEYWQRLGYAAPPASRVDGVLSRQLGVLAPGETSGCARTTPEDEIAAAVERADKNMQRVVEQARSDRQSPGVQFFAVFFVVLDGSLQCFQQKVDVRLGPERHRVYVRWAVPTTRLEWDGAPFVGTDRPVRVVVFGASEHVIARDMQCRWFAVRHDVKDVAVARAIFECPASLADGRR
jgi:hypothetical protein